MFQDDWEQNCQSWQADFQSTQGSDVYSSNSLPQNLLHLYQQSICPIPQSTTLLTISQQTLKHHRISLVGRSYQQMEDEVFTPKCASILVKTIHYAYHCVYTVVIGPFKLEINVLNVHRDSDQCDQSVRCNQIGRGGFGNVRAVEISNICFAVKRINFRVRRQLRDEFDEQSQMMQRQQVERAIQEYGIYKICSMLKVGPEIIFRNNYDLICYNNCIQFLMQLCPPPKSNPNLPWEQLNKNLKFCLRTLHSLRIVHRDIKPDNVLYSEAHAKFVFTDFGLTHTVEETYEEQTETAFCGTLEFMSEDLRGLMSQKRGRVNLYLNDFHSLRLTLQRIKITRKSYSSFTKNSMSFQPQSSDFEEYASSQSYNSLENQAQVSQPQEIRFKNIYQAALRALNAPQTNASIINYYQAQILFDIFELKDRCSIVKREDISRIIHRHLGDLQDQQIKTKIISYVQSTFYPSKHQTLTLSLGHLKNVARHYGPKSLLASQCIKDILHQLQNTNNNDYSTTIYFRELKEYLQSQRVDKLQVTHKTLGLLAYLRKYDILIDYLIKMLRKSVWLLTNKLPTNIPVATNHTLFCCLYILCISSQMPTQSELAQINSLFCLLWEPTEQLALAKSISQLQLPPEQKGRRQTKQISYILLKFACHKLYEQQYNHCPIYIKALLSYVDAYLVPDKQQVQDYLSLIEKVEQRAKIDGTKDIEKLSTKVLQIELYSKLIRILPDCESSMLNLIDELRHMDTQAKVYYHCALNRQAAFFIKHNQINKALDICHKIQQSLQTVENSNDFEKCSIQIDLFKNYGVAYLQQHQYQKALQYLAESKNVIIRSFSKQSYVKHLYEIARNIAIVHYKRKELIQAMKVYDQIINDVQSSRCDLVLEKAWIYRSVLLLKIQAGVSQKDYAYLDELITKIVDYTVLSIENYSHATLRKQHVNYDKNLFNFLHLPQDIRTTIFIMKSLRKKIQSYTIFTSLAEKLSLQLFKIYNNQMRMPDRAIRWLAFYVDSKWNKPNSFGAQHFRMIHFLAERLVSINQTHKAQQLLTKYVFYFPLGDQQLREKIFKIYHRALTDKKSPWGNITSQLVKDQCLILSTHRYELIRLKKQFEKSLFWQKLLQKWINRLCMRVNNTY